MASNAVVVEEDDDENERTGISMNVESVNNRLAGQNVEDINHGGNDGGGRQQYVCRDDMGVYQAASQGSHQQRSGQIPPTHNHIQGDSHDSNGVMMTGGARYVPFPNEPHGFVPSAGETGMTMGPMHLQALAHYEARMRDSAAAFASAAAGAAWAAAQLASTSSLSHGREQQSNEQSGSSAAMAASAFEVAASSASSVAHLLSPHPVHYPEQCAYQHLQQPQPPSPQQQTAHYSPGFADVTGVGMGRMMHPIPRAHAHDSSMPMGIHYHQPPRMPMEGVVPFPGTDGAAYREGCRHLVLGEGGGCHDTNHGGAGASGAKKRHQRMGSHENCSPHYLDDRTTNKRRFSQPHHQLQRQPFNRNTQHDRQFENNDHQRQQQQFCGGLREHRTLYDPQSHRRAKGPRNSDTHSSVDSSAGKFKGRRRQHSDAASGNSSGGGSARHVVGKKQKPHHHHGSQGHPRPFNPLGKTGVMALHELCSKRHWEPPKFMQISTTSGKSQDAQEGGPLAAPTSGSSFVPSVKRPMTSSSSIAPTSTTPLHFHEFIISVVVDGRELGRGRGGTKAAARQDAARKALATLLPGIVFDSNGVLIEAPSSLGGPDVQQGEKFSALRPSEDLAPLASRLVLLDREHLASPSPAPSEDSSILSAATSQHGSASGVSSKSMQVHVYPCASSGMSSADSGAEDEDTYYASRGASVCSTLLHAMWQIDERIQEPPSYAFDLVRPAAVSAHRSSFSCTAKLVLRVVSNIMDEKQASEERHTSEHAAKLDVTRTVNRSSGAQGVEEDRELPERLDDGVIEEPSLGVEDNEPSADISHERKVQSLQAVGTGATKREARHAASARLLALLFPNCSGTVEVIAAAEAAREAYAASKAQYKQCKKSLSISARGNKRDSKALLRSRGGAAAELLAPSSTDPVLPSFVARQLRSVTGITSAGALNDASNHGGHEELLVSSRKNESDANASVEMLSSSEQLISVENLSISERSDNALMAAGTQGVFSASKPGKGRTNTGSMNCDETKLKVFTTENAKEATVRQIARQTQLEEEVDAALQRLHDFEDDGKSSFGSVVGDDNVGKIHLRRATMEDSAWVTELLSCSKPKGRGGNQPDVKPRVSRSSRRAYVADNCSLSPVSLLVTLGSPENESAGEHTMFRSNVAHLLWGGRSVVLLLSRVFGAQHEPPLACAILTIGFSFSEGRTLRVSDMACKEHLPRERFVECLEALASSMKYSLEDTTQRAKPRAPRLLHGYELSERQLIRMVEDYTAPDAPGRKAALSNTRPTGSPGSTLPLILNETHPCTLKEDGLQAVKEESSEEENEAALDGEGKVCSSGPNQDKPSKRTRVS